MKLSGFHVSVVTDDPNPKGDDVDPEGTDGGNQVTEIFRFGPSGLKYGQSVTDTCVSWERTVSALGSFRRGVQGRRAYRLTRGLELDA